MLLCVLLCVLLCSCLLFYALYLVSQLYVSTPRFGEHSGGGSSQVFGFKRFIPKVLKSTTTLPIFWIGFRAKDPQRYPPCINHICLYIIQIQHWLSGNVSQSCTNPTWRCLLDSMVCLSSVHEIFFTIGYCEIFNWASYGWWFLLMSINWASKNTKEFISFSSRKL